MIVTTRWRFACAPETVWPLLCGSRMQPTRHGLFRFGLPQPQVCRLPSGAGGPGGMRQCVSDQGVIDQRILAWEPPRHLAFRMERSDIARLSYVSDILEDFELAPGARGGATVTRTTRVQVSGRFRWAKSVLVWLGLMHIHRFVFRNWERVADRGTDV